MTEVTRAQRAIDDLVEADVDLARIEQRAIQPAVGLDGEQEAALWLYAWSRVSRRGETGRGNVVPLRPPDGTTARGRGQREEASLA